MKKLMTNEERDLYKKMRILRSELEKIALVKGFTDPEVIKISKRLDKIIVQLQIRVKT